MDRWATIKYQKTNINLILVFLQLLIIIITADQLANYNYKRILKQNLYFNKKLSVKQNITMHLHYILIKQTKQTIIK